MKSVIILAAGSGSRCGLGYNKLLYKINGKMLIEYTINQFDGYEIILTVNSNDFNVFKEKFSDYKIVIGGETRQESVRNAINVCSNENILIHDGARIFIDKETILNVENAILKNNAVVPCVKVKDSIKNQFGKNIERNNLFIAQTPQAVKKSLYLSCFGKEYSDDVSVLEQCGYDVCIVEGNYNNIKITTIEDIEFAKFKLGGRNDLS
ncbi:MAG: 2-C-methyl-D-erythritol 4-phosphate cytidylyltransferase [Bacilli bacterium]